MEIGEREAEFDVEGTLAVSGSSEVLLSRKSTMFRKEDFQAYTSPTNISGSVFTYRRSFYSRQHLIDSYNFNYTSSLCASEQLMEITEGQSVVKRTLSRAFKVWREKESNGHQKD